MTRAILWIVCAFLLPVRALQAQGSAATVHLLHVEITQGLQDNKQTIPLIQGKPTYVRAYFNYSGASAIPVVGQIVLQDSASGERIEVDSMSSVSAKLDSKLNDRLLDQRETLQAGLVFHIPEDWANRSSMGIEAISVRSSVPPVAILNCNNCGAINEQFSLIAGVPLRLQIILLRYQKDGQIYQPRPVDVDYTISFLRRVYPAGTWLINWRIVDWNPNPVFAGVGANFTCETANTLLSQIRKLDIDNGGDPLAHYYGMVFDGGSQLSDEQSMAQWMRGCAAAIPSVPDPSAVASGPTGTHPPTWPPSRWPKRQPTYGDWYAAHEIGHTFGRSHVGTSCGDQPKDINYPIQSNPAGLIFDDTHQFIGFDSGDRDLEIPMAVLPPKATFDSMTYCPGEWIGHYNYLAMCADLNAEGGGSCGSVQPSAALVLAAKVGAQPKASGSLAGPPTANATPMSYLTLTGEINYTQNTARFSVDPTTTLAPTGPPQPSTTTVELRNSRDEVIATYPVVEFLSSDRPPGADQTGNISATFPYLPEIARVVLLRNGHAIAFLGSGITPRELPSPTPSTPSIKDVIKSLGPYAKTAQSGVGRIEEQGGKIVYSWATDQAEPGTKYNVLISLDGQNWKVVGINLEQSSLALDPTWIAGADYAKLRVIAINGIKHREVTSDQLSLAH